MNHDADKLTMDSGAIAAWMSRIKSGDEVAAGEFVRHYEPEIRRFIRFRMTDPKLRRFLDSMDVCQSVMARFFQRLQAGQITVEHPLQLVKLLMTMARNSLFDHARKARVRRVISGENQEDMVPVADSRPGPDEQFEQADLVSLVRQRLRGDERQALDRWLLGYGWEEISQDLNCEPDAIRKKVTRAIDRATGELNLLEQDHA